MTASTPKMYRPRSPRDYSQWVSGSLPGNGGLFYKYDYSKLMHDKDGMWSYPDDRFENLYSIAVMMAGQWIEEQKAFVPVNLKWTDIAQLNYGTEMPTELDWYFSHFNQCTLVKEGDPAGPHYAFGPSDANPFVYIPLTSAVGGTSVNVDPMHPKRKAVTLQLPPPPTPFTKVITRRWTEIDLNKDGAIRADELRYTDLRKIISNPAFGGDDSAAAAALIMQMLPPDPYGAAQEWQGKKTVTQADLAYFDRWCRLHGSVAKLGDTQDLIERYTAKHNDVPANVQAMIDAVKKDYETEHAKDSPPAAPYAPTIPDNILKSDPEILIHIFGSDSALRGDLVEKKFIRARAKIALIGDVLIADSPDTQYVRQSGTGDCWYEAVVAGLRSRAPIDVPLLVVEKSFPGLNALDGRAQYEVSLRTLPDNSPPIRVSPTDTEIAFYGYSGGNGLWPPVLERAVATLALASDRPGLDKNDMVDTMDGGNAERVIPYFTGHAASSYPLTGFADEAGQARLDKILVAWCTSANWIITAIINPDKAAPDNGGRTATNWVVEHVYTVWGYDQPTKMVSIRNPWRKDRAGNAYTTGAHASESITLVEFVANFSAIQLELWDGAPTDLLVAAQ